MSSKLSKPVRQDSDETDSDSEDDEKVYTKLDGDIILYKPDFEIFEGNINGKDVKYLYIFEDDSQKYCYKFIRQHNYFFCSRCFYKKHYIKANIRKDSDGDEMVVLANNREHICEPIEFELPQENEAKIVRAPNYQLVKRKYKGKTVQKLVVFDENDRDLCYEYTWLESHNWFRCNPCIGLYSMVYAKIKTDEDGEEYAELSQTEHVCTPKKFVPENLDAKILKQPDFKIDKYVSNGIERKRIIVYDKKKPGFFYLYSFKNNNVFACSPCDKRKKYITVKLCRNEYGQDFLEVYGEHVCKSRKTLRNANKK